MTYLMRCILFGVFLTVVSSGTINGSKNVRFSVINNADSANSQPAESRPVQQEQGYGTDGQVQSNPTNTVKHRYRRFHCELYSLFKKPVSSYNQPKLSVEHSEAHISDSHASFIVKRDSSEDSDEADVSDDVSINKRKPQEPNNEVREDVPDYSLLLASKPFFDSLLIEKKLLKKLERLEQIKEIKDSSNPFEIQEQTIMKEKDEVYKRDFVLKIIELKTAIMSFLNWRTADRLKNEYAGTVLGVYEHRPLSKDDFYQEVKYIIDMVRLADFAIEIESKNYETIEPTGENDQIEESMAQENQNGDAEDQNGAESQDNSVENDSNELVQADVNNDSQDTKFEEKSEEVVSDGNEEPDNGSSDVNVEKKSEEVENEPGHFDDGYTIPYWKLWIMERRFNMLKYPMKDNHVNRWPPLQHAALLNSKCKGAILNTKTKDTYLNSKKLYPQSIYKRGFSMLSRLRLFSLLADGYRPQRRIFIPKGSVLYLKNNNVISAETRAMLRPVGTPLRWG